MKKAIIIVAGLIILLFLPLIFRFAKEFFLLAFMPLGYDYGRVCSEREVMWGRLGCEPSLICELQSCGGGPEGGCLALPHCTYKLTR